MNAGWLPIGLSQTLAPGAVVPVVLDGRDLALWRGPDGTAHAWPDRCPHRGMRLSFGFVRGDALACIYHGWQYAGSGQCVYVPAQPEFKPGAKICVTGFACQEASGLIWAALDAAPQDTAPDLAPLSASLTPVRSMAVAAGAETIGDALERSAFPPFALCGEGQARPAPRDGDSAQWWSDGRELGTVRYEHASPAPCLRIMTAHAQTGTEHLIVALQPVDAGRSTLHMLVASDTPADHQAALRSHYHHWLRRLRRAIETGATAQQHWSPYHG